MLPIPFILTKNNQLIIVIKNTDTIVIKFKELIDVQMGWFYFEVAFIDNALNPLQKIEHVNTATKCVLLPTVCECNKIGYTAVSSHWLTLDHKGCFEVYSNLNMKIKHPIT